MSTVRATGPAIDTLDAEGHITLTVPIVLKRRSPQRGLTPMALASPHPATALQRALARGHRWLRQLQAGDVASIKDIAQREKEDNSYVARMLNLTLLAPEIVEAILSDTLPSAVHLEHLAINPPMLWEKQHKRWHLNR